MIHRTIILGLLATVCVVAALSTGATAAWIGAGVLVAAAVLAIVLRKKPRERQ